MGGFTPMNPPTVAPQPLSTQAAPQSTPAMSPLASPMGSSPLPQVAGIMDQIRSLALTLQQGRQTLETVAAQFPLAAQPVRDASELLGQVSQKVVEIVTAVYTQAQEVQGASPRILG